MKKSLKKPNIKKINAKSKRKNDRKNAKKQNNPNTELAKEQNNNMFVDDSKSDNKSDTKNNSINSKLSNKSEEKLDSLKHTRKKVKKAQKEPKNGNVQNAQESTQKRETDLIGDLSSKNETEKLKKAIDSDKKKPKLTGILNTNIKILDVLTKLYQGSHDDQDTSINSKKEDPKKEDPKKEDQNKKKPKKKKIKKDGSLLKSLLSFAIIGPLAKVLFKGLFGSFLRFSPIKILIKSVKFLTSILTKGVINTIKFIGKIGLKTLKGMVSFVGKLMPYAKKILKFLSNMAGKTVKAGLKVVKATISKGSSKVITKAGEKVATKLAGKIALKAGSKVAMRAATASIPIAGWAVTAGLTAMDASSGWKNAAESLNIKKDEVTTTNKTASALSSVLTLGIGSKGLSKTINKAIGGESSTIIKRYENNNVIEHHIIGNSDVNFEKFKKLTVKEMKEVVSINDFSNQDMQKMASIISNKIDINKSTMFKNKTSQVNISNNTTENKFSNITVNNNKNMYDNKNKSIKNISYNKQSNINKTSNRNINNTINNDNKTIVDKKKTIVDKNKTIVNKNKTIVNKNININNIRETNNVNKNTENINKLIEYNAIVEAKSNKKYKEQSTYTNSDNLAKKENNQSAIISAQIAQIHVNNQHFEQPKNDAQGGDRVLNLFQQLS